MMSAKRILLLLFLTASVGLSGQYTKEFKRIFFDADYLYETEFYEEAFNRYKNLLTLDPGNSNILFHCGACRDFQRSALPAEKGSFFRFLQSGRPLWRYCPA